MEPQVAMLDRGRSTKHGPRRWERTRANLSAGQGSSIWNRMKMRAGPRIPTDDDAGGVRTGVRLGRGAVEGFLAPDLSNFLSWVYLVRRRPQRRVGRLDADGESLDSGTHALRNSRTACLERRTYSATCRRASDMVSELLLSLRSAASPDAPGQPPFVLPPSQSRLVAAVGQLEASRTLAYPADQCSPCTDPPRRVEVHDRVGALQPKVECGVVVAVDESTRPR